MFNLELICTCEIFQKLNLNLTLNQLMQFQLCEKLTSANLLQIELETV